MSKSRTKVLRESAKGLVAIDLVLAQQPVFDHFPGGEEGLIPCEECGKSLVDHWMKHGERWFDFPFCCMSRWDTGIYDEDDYDVNDESDPTAIPRVTLFFTSRSEALRAAMSNFPRGVIATQITEAEFEELLDQDIVLYGEPNKEES